MKREWEEEQERMIREAGLTKETLERINEWISNQPPEGCGCDNCVCGDADD
jgi:hypothetical protein